MNEKVKKRLEDYKLSHVSGGRDVRISEYKEWEEAEDAMSIAEYRLRQQGRYRESEALVNDFCLSSDRFFDDVFYAPEDGPDIKFSDYFMLK